jgi:phage terminase large subunit
MTPRAPIKKPSKPVTPVRPRREATQVPAQKAAPAKTPAPAPVQIPDGTKHSYAPRGSCRKILGCRDPEVLISGPAGTGKSRACMEKLHMMCLLNPGMRGLIARKSATSLSSTALVTWRRFVAKEAIDSGDVVYYGGSAQESASYQYKNGSVVVIGGLDKVSKIMSAEYDVIYIQEATELSENDWEALTTRLRNWRVSFQQLLADCNPSHPDHWLKIRADRGVTTMFDSIHEENPILFNPDGTATKNGREYIKKLDSLTGVRYKRLRLGLWVAAEGVIYEEYNSGLHIIDRDQLPKTEYKDASGIPMDWTRYWAIDFGYVNPFVCQFWAEDPDGKMYLYREIYHTGRTVDQHANKIKSLVLNERGAWREPKPRAIICDHDAEGRAVLERELSIATEPAHKSVLEGIEAVQVRLRPKEGVGPRMLFLRNAVVEEDPELRESGRPTCTIDEIPGYVWSNKKKEEPVKQDDHGCDAMRYMAAYQDFGIRVIFRSFTV